MALITCPECRWERLSEFAESCPRCGYKLIPGEGAKIRKRMEKIKEENLARRAAREAEEKEEARKKYWRELSEEILGCVGTIVFFILMLLIMFLIVKCNDL